MKEEHIIRRQLSENNKIDVCIRNLGNAYNGFLHHPQIINPIVAIGGLKSKLKNTKNDLLKGYKP
jgi:hypothetical protein